MNELTPTYLEADFATLKQKFISILQNNDTFKDYNFEGSNITMLIELLSYLSEMNTYYANKLAKNMFLDTTDIYETASLMANLRGYYPKGYIASKLKLNVTLNVDEFSINIPNPGDQIYIPKYFPFESGLQFDGEDINFITPRDYTFTIPLTATDTYEFQIELKQGEVETLSYNGEDVINNVIYLPFFNFDNDVPPYEESSSIVVYVNGEPWTRVDNFVDDYSNLVDDDKVYRFEYNKFQQYCIRFSTAHSIPKSTDQIRIFALKTLGEGGSIASFTINEFENVQNIPSIQGNTFQYNDNYFIRNVTKNYGVWATRISIENRENSYGALNPETIRQIVSNSTNVLQSQYRNVTRKDYNGFLETYQDVVKANSWGENEINPYNTQEYNKVYLSVIPNRWDDSTILVDEDNWIITPGLTATINIPSEYTEIYVNKMKEYLEPKKYLNTFETFVLPELVYFILDIGIKVKRLYNFTNVKNDVEEKLKYYFRTNYRNFNEIIDFKDLHNFILDIKQVSTTNNFSNVRGIDNLVIRDIMTYTPSITADQNLIYEPNDQKLYPQYTKELVDMSNDNLLRPIKLGFNQFPVLLPEGCTYNNEE